MIISSAEDLSNAEMAIGIQIGRHSLDSIFASIRTYSASLPPFVQAAVAHFAVRHARAPGQRTAQLHAVPWHEFERIARLVTNYVLADPATFTNPDQPEFSGSTIFPVLLRIVGNQAPFDALWSGQYARSLVLYRDIPARLDGRSKMARFDVNAAFAALNGASIQDFLDISLATFVAASQNFGFSSGWFTKARDEGLRLPNDEVIRHVLNNLAADQAEMQTFSAAYQQRDRRFAAYDFNPLFVRPLIRPWPLTGSTTFDDDRFIAPLPELILTRLSEGIYHQLFQAHREPFSQYFGHLFEEYVGLLLRESVAGAELISESEIRRSYGERRGKVPDWIVVAGDKAVFLECKAAGYSRRALATADATAVEQSLAPVITGLTQLQEFRSACLSKAPGLERFHNLVGIECVVVTFEPFYLANSGPGRELIVEGVQERLAVTGFPVAPWYVLSVEELELLQPHAAAGISLHSIIRRLREHPAGDVLRQISEESGASRENSYVYSLEEEFYARLGLNPYGPQAPNTLE